MRESLIIYYKENIEKHRDVMTRAKGRKISQHTKENEIVKIYNSIREADRISGIKKSNIQQVLSGNTKTAGGYIWKYVD